MTTPVPDPGSELTLIHALRLAGHATCARSRMAPAARQRLRDALMAEARRGSAATPSHVPAQHTRALAGV